MSENSRISWTDHTFNPWIGCQKVSEGCKNCYAESFAKRRIGQNLWGPNSSRHITKTWQEPFKWNRRASASRIRERVFCASLADVFEDRPDLIPHRQRLWELVRATESLDWLILTKRPENITRMLPLDWAPYLNVWLGVSAENQARWNERVPILCKVPAVVHFVSYEPALGPVDPSSTFPMIPEWIIVGGESGPKRRPFDEYWARGMRAACKQLGIAFFYKQKGGLMPDGGAPFLDGITHHEWPTPRMIP